MQQSDECSRATSAVERRMECNVAMPALLPYNLLVRMFTMAVLFYFLFLLAVACYCDFRYQAVFVAFFVAACLLLC